MPMNLLLIRHGESDGNIAVESAKHGDPRHYTDKFMTIPGHQWRLSPKGREQAATTGTWVNEKFDSFDRYIVSPYVRTRETAGLLGLHGAQWMLNRAVRERDWGDIGSLTRDDFKSRTELRANYHMFKIDPLYWQPAGGESIAQVAENRVRNLLDTLHRETSEKDVVVVAHGEFMWATRMVLERWNDEEFLVRDADKSQKITNAQVIWYTRKNPWTGEVARKLSWVMVASPELDESGQWGMMIRDWEQFDSGLLTNAELLDSIKDVPSAIEY